MRINGKISEVEGMADDRGFSLIELLVAVSILAIAAVTLLESQTQAIGMTTRVEEKTLASLVAENQMNLTLGALEQPSVGNAQGQQVQMGVPFLWRRSVSAAPGSDLLLIRVSVYRDGGQQELTSLTGFRRRVD